MTYDEKTVHDTVEAQRAYFRTGETLDTGFRIRMLKKLKETVLAHREELEEALRQDLGRAPLEAYFCDIGSLVLEINETLRGLRRWARTKTVFSGFLCFPSTVTKIARLPYGVALIISPFNFPILLSLGVLTAAIAGGNTAVIKASSKSVHCTALLEKLVSEAFPPEYVTVIGGGHDIADMCLNERFDKIFYTGSPKVGVHVLEAAAKNLTPAALELGGETGNWCVIRKDADLKDAARKIAFFKALNAGQICINVNQAAVAEEVAEDFVRALEEAFVSQLGSDPVQNPEYPRLINEAAYDKCAGTAERYRSRIVFGGNGDRETLKYAPTLIYPVRADEEIVQRELFCPLLPIVTYKDREIDALLQTIEEREHGLALYLFTKDIGWAKHTMQRMQYGGGCINEVCLHMMVKGAPFNGTGHSGMGAYHGKYGFEEFTHPATFLIGRTHMNLPLREHPYGGKWKKTLVQWFER